MGKVYINGQTAKEYDSGVGNKGNYQFVNLEHIISGFMAIYTGASKILTKVSRTDVQFHAMRAIQELSYDVLRSHKSWEFEVPGRLLMYLPQDYVNYTKIVRVDSNGIERPVYPTGKTSNPFPITQAEDTNGDGWRDISFYASTTDAESGVVTNECPTCPDQGIKLSPQPSSKNPYESTTKSSFNSVPSSNSNQDYDSLDATRFDNRGRRYGLDPQHAQQNGTFYIDNATGFVHFSSDLSGETVILKYISDGLGTADEMIVHKFCEEAVYKHIMYALVSARSGIPEGVVLRFKKERFAETRKAKIRLSNIKMEEFTQILKGISKPIK